MPRGRRASAAGPVAAAATPAVPASLYAEDEPDLPALPQVPSNPAVLEELSAVLSSLFEFHRCPICREEPINTIRTSCGHSFCEHCFDKMVRKCNQDASTRGGSMVIRCPMCRKTITQRSKHKLERVQKALDGWGGFKKALLAEMPVAFRGEDHHIKVVSKFAPTEQQQQQQNMPRTKASRKEVPPTPPSASASASPSPKENNMNVPNENGRGKGRKPRQARASADAAAPAAASEPVAGPSDANANANNSSASLNSENSMLPVVELVQLPSSSLPNSPAKSPRGKRKSSRPMKMTKPPPDINTDEDDSDFEDRRPKFSSPSAKSDANGSSCAAPCAHCRLSASSSPRTATIATQTTAADLDASVTPSKTPRSKTAAKRGAGGRKSMDVDKSLLSPPPPARGGARGKAPNGSKDPDTFIDSTSSSQQSQKKGSTPARRGRPPGKKAKLAAAEAAEAASSSPSRPTPRASASPVKLPRGGSSSFVSTEDSENEMGNMKTTQDINQRLAMLKDHVSKKTEEDEEDADSKSIYSPTQKPSSRGVLDESSDEDLFSATPQRKTVQRSSFHKRMQALNDTSASEVANGSATGSKKVAAAKRKAAGAAAATKRKSFLDDLSDSSLDKDAFDDDDDLDVKPAKKMSAAAARKNSSKKRKLLTSGTPSASSLFDRIAATARPVPTTPLAADVDIDLDVDTALPPLSLSSSPPAAPLSSPPGAKGVPKSESRRYVLLTSGITETEMKKVDQFKKLAECALKKTMEANVTHLVVNHDDQMCADRTLKYLQAVAAGKTVVGIDWIRKSVESKAVLDPAQFEVKDQDGDPGPAKARAAKKAAGKSKRGLVFSKFEFCLHGDFNAIPRDRLKRLLEDCGGVVVRSQSTMSFHSGSTPLVVVDKDCVADENDCVKIFCSTDVACVDKDWVIDSIGRYTVSPIRNHLQHDASVERLKEIGYRHDIVVGDEDW